MSKVPPSKKLKQMDPQSSPHQSPKKQTGRDHESGETSKDAQKTMAHSVKKEVEEGPSKDLQQEPEEKKHTFRFDLNAETFSVACKKHMTVLEALNTSHMFRNESSKKKNTQREVLIQRSKGKHPRAAVKTDFPCCLIEEDEILYITFIPKDGNSSTNHQTIEDSSLLSKRSKPEALVTFWVKKGGGSKVKCLLKSKALRKSVCYVCVFAFKGETVRKALKRDGRFKNVIFKKDCGLYEFGYDTKHELSKPVENLDKKDFQVVVISDKIQPDSQDDVPLVKNESNVASETDAAENVSPSQNPSNTKKEKKQNGKTSKSTNPSPKRYVAKPIDKSEEILKILRDQYKDLQETLEQRKNPENKSQVQMYREEYHKSVENFLVVKKVKELMRLSDSVCQIRDGESPIGTGFLLFDRFILTNAHVIGISTVNVAQFRAVFDYEVLNSQIKSIPVKFAVCFYGKDESGRHLDYALLELDLDPLLFNEIAEYPELLSCYRPDPPINRGQICIVGHPGEGVKKMDPCIVIEKEKRLDAADEHASENNHLIHVMKEVKSKEKWDFSAYANQFTYNSCFFHGSSGSPVFDVNCNLIGVHTGGYKYKEEGCKTWSVMEYGFTMQPILDNIRAQAKIKGLQEIIKILDYYSGKSNVSVPAEQQNQTDSEMSSAEESLE